MCGSVPLFFSSFLPWCVFPVSGMVCRVPDGVHLQLPSVFRPHVHSLGNECCLWSDSPGPCFANRHLVILLK